MAKQMPSGLPKPDPGYEWRVDLSDHIAERYSSDDYKLETAAHGPVHTVDAGRYYAIIRDGVPMIERADTTGAVLHVEESVSEWPQVPAKGVDSHTPPPPSGTSRRKEDATP